LGLGFTGGQSIGTRFYRGPINGELGASPSESGCAKDVPSAWARPVSREVVTLPHVCLDKCEDKFG
jgi:hypothetical protein